MTDQTSASSSTTQQANKSTNQSRRLISTWQKLNKSPWSTESFQQLQLINQRLIAYAERFQDNDHLTVAKAIDQVLKSLIENSSGDTDQLTQRIRDLAKITLRKSDQNEAEQEEPQLKLRKPLYLALNDESYSEKLAKQLSYFGLQSKTISTAIELDQNLRITHPAMLIIDANFGGELDMGIDYVQNLKGDSENLPFPVSFTSPEKCSLTSRLKAIRTGSRGFYTDSIDPGQLIESIESDLDHNQVADNDFKVLVLDDSRSQAHFIDTTLKKAQMNAKVITDPMLILDSLEEYQPDLIVLDMYMPGCTGSEVANVIRQHEKWVSTPIIFLSAEDDINKQLQAMSLGGGDDFLTKPINPDHLIRTIKNRGKRAKSLLALMVRDSLTGLYNHTHTLHKLDSSIQQTQRDNQPLSFAMLDIDHFKQVNDTYGHPIGDKVIKSLALFLKQRLRKTDIIGRYGGEEFAVVLPNTSATDAVMIFNGILEKFSKIGQAAGDTEFNVTFSCGIATLTSDVSDASELSEMADKALYDAKHSGRNCVRLFTGQE